MGNLRGFLWSMGRCATKAVSETISQSTGVHATSWVDTPKIVESPSYYLRALPDPFILTLHHPQHCDAFGRIVAAHRNLPVVFTVRDPVANLESYANTFLTSYIARRVDEAEKMVAKGASLSASINPAALDQWLLPTANLWRQYNCVKDSPLLVVDFSELSEQIFPATMKRMLDFLELPITSPIAWVGESNTTSDRFLIGYMRTFRVLDRNLELRFTRWDDYWGESGLVTLGTISSSHLRPLLGCDGPLIVQARADQLLTEGRIDLERRAFAKLFADQSGADAIAAQIASDFARTTAMVSRELAILQEQLVTKFMRTCRDGVRRLLKQFPDLEANWTRWQQCATSKAA